MAAVGIVCFVTTAFANEPSRDWPRWRGPKADGVADDRKLPTQWSPSENICWSVKLPGWGTSSPVVYGSRVFVTSELNQEGKKSLLTLGFDRTEGRELWRDDFGFGVNQLVHEKSNPAVLGNNDGQTFVVKARATFELLATNDLGERMTASPAISGDELIYRTDSHLYCIGTPDRGSRAD